MPERHSNGGSPDFYSEFADRMLEMSNNETLPGTNAIQNFYAAKEALTDHLDDVVVGDVRSQREGREHLESCLASTATEFAIVVLDADTRNRDEATKLAAEMHRIMSRDIHQFIRQYDTSQMIDIPPIGGVVDEYNKLLEAYDDEPDVVIDPRTGESLVGNAVAKMFHDQYYRDVVDLFERLDEFGAAVRRIDRRSMLGRIGIVALFGRKAGSLVGRLRKRRSHGDSVE